MYIIYQFVSIGPFLESSKLYPSFKEHVLLGKNEPKLRAHYIIGRDSMPHFTEIRTVVSEIKLSHEQAPSYYAFILRTSFKNRQKMHLKFSRHGCLNFYLMHRIL